MCLAIPMKIEGLNENVASASLGGTTRNVYLDLMSEEVAIGDYVLVHAGFAIHLRPALTTVRQKLANLKTSSEPVKGYDGPIKTLAVVTKNSTVIYSPDAGCGEQDKMVKIVSGWDELWDSLRAL